MDRATDEDCRQQELLCLPKLQGQNNLLDFQLETVRKVIFKMGGRAILADEVGLGKTVEAAIVIKELMIRGKANKILIISPK